MLKTLFKDIQSLFMAGNSGNTDLMDLYTLYRLNLYGITFKGL